MYFVSVWSQLILDQAEFNGISKTKYTSIANAHKIIYVVKFSFECKVLIQFQGNVCHILPLKNAVTDILNLTQNTGSDTQNTES